MVAGVAFFLMKRNFFLFITVIALSKFRFQQIPQKNEFYFHRHIIELGKICHISKKKTTHTHTKYNSTF